MCVAPVTIRKKNDDYVFFDVPCGKCFECRNARSAAWAFRLEQENKMHVDSSFVTLTLDDDHLTTTDDGELTLVKSDLQNFFKRLRKNTKKHVKYFACGEYGTSTRRPHYHGIIFGAPADDIAANWKSGHVTFGDVSPASVRYVTNYLLKSVPRDNYTNLPEFALMSKGLGANYLTPQMLRYHLALLANYAVTSGGKKQALPRYYKDRIFSDKQKAQFGIDYRKLIDDGLHKFDLTDQQILDKVQSGYTDYEVSVLLGIHQAMRSDAYKQSNRNTL